MCEESISEFSPSDASNCNSGCTGNPSLPCGGKEHASVYSSKVHCCKVFASLNLKTSFRPACLQFDGLLSFVRCSELFQCVGSHDMFGGCHGGCKAGFFGEQCIGRGRKNLVLWLIDNLLVDHNVEECNRDSISLTIESLLKLEMRYWSFNKFVAI